MNILEDLQEYIFHLESNHFISIEGGQIFIIKSLYMMFFDMKWLLLGVVQGPMNMYY